ncbi:MAG TPA: DNA recombination protein RmuC [Acidimicrobiia bacterium]|nr:DNA recombination protein RmuC [Acidimicrobiia bacterium]
MTTALAIVTSLAIVGVVVVAARAAVRRVRTETTVAPEEIRALHTELGRLIGRVQAGFETSEREASTVRSALDLLTHNSGRRGSWGEVTLRRLLEAAGMTHGVDFDTQVDLPGGRPDSVVHLGDAGDVVIDAKAPLDDLRRAWEAESEAEQEACLKAHAGAVRRHVRDLHGRDYPARLRSTFAPVVMYLPVEGAWEAAIEANPGLGGEALALGVHPASPRTLGLVLEVLKHHALTVNQEAATREILEDTRELLTRLDKHAEHLAKLGNALGTAVDAYNSAVGNAATRLLPSTNRMTAHLGRQQVEAPAAVTTLPQAERIPEFDGANRVA